jgi:hypothetical protein
VPLRPQVVLTLVLATAMAVFADKPVTVNADLAEGAAIAATCRLGQDRQDETGRRLLAFALAMDPENERALLLQSRLEGDQELERVELEDGGRQFVAFVEGAAAKARSKARSLLLYRVITLVDPQHPKARQELTRARNQGVDVDFEALLRNGRPTEAPRPDEPGKSPGGSGRDVLKDLADLTFSTSGSEEFQLYDEPLRIVNQLNRQLRPAAPAIRVSSKTRTVEIYDDGKELRSAAFHSRAFRSPGYFGPPSDQLSGMNGRAVLLIVCALHELGWQQQNGELTLVDSADASGPGAGGLTDAQALASQAKKSQVDVLKTYRGRDLVVSGVASGLGKSSPRFIHLANDQIRIYFGPGKAAEAALHKLAEEYDRATRTERTGRDGEDEAPPRALLFIGTAKFDGITSGRITFKGCSDFTCLRTRPSHRD